MAKEKKKPTMGPVRQNLEAFGVAILAAVLLKWFCIEAFQIPTSSMQPTLMGSNEAGVYDRIIVDKIIQTFREPKRWDITVFKYPLQKNQNYVKRIGGMPGDRLLIAGGNLYQVKDVDGKRSYETIRKPDDLQQQMWKDVYPGRRIARAETKALGTIFAASPSSAASEDAGGFVLALTGNPVRLFFRDEAEGGMIDRVWDGYPEAVARAMRERTPLTTPQEIVPDVRIGAEVTAEQVPEQLSLEIEVRRPDADTWTYALALKNGTAELQVKKGNEVLARSPEFAFALAAGAATGIGFAHVDDQLVAWRDGDEVQRFDSSAFAIRSGCELPLDEGHLPTGNDGRLKLPGNQGVTPQFVVKGKGKVRFDDVRIDRDQHYTRLGAPEIIEVPERHYYMLGDNTLQSIDSRGWTAITIYVDDQGNVVPPATPGARAVRGNKRAMPLDRSPDRDETPIALPDQKVIVMIDEYGEIHRFHANISSDWGRRIAFLPDGAQDGRGEWTAIDTTNTKGISFVPREDIQGRALLVFYPSRPLSWLFGSNWPGRFGFVR
ncbi:MAG: signal peptidase I [Planctomycetes bacterium]|nr:signal peptidase I [Planctomycetota bacterium]MCC7398086.1 signal peptidase I [Planctomycetota bacterium]